MRLLKTHQLRVDRKTSEKFFSGGKAHYKTETISLTCSRQPISGKEEKYYEAFAQSLAKLKIWSKSNVIEDDIIYFEEKKYRIFRVQDYSGYNLRVDNYEAYGVEVPDGK